MTSPSHDDLPRRIWKKAYSSNQTTADFPSVIPSTTATSGFIPLQDSFVDLAFIGTDADGEAFTYRVYLVFSVGGADGTTPLYVPVLAAAGAATLSALVGIEGAILADTDFFADTLTVTAPASLTETGIILNSPAGDISPAMLTIPTHGAAGFVVVFDLSTAASANALWKTH